MKTKIARSLFISMVALLLMAPQAFALYIDIQPNGQMNFYQSSVLGDSDEVEHEEEEEEEHEEENEREEEHEREEERKRIKKQTPIKVIPKREEKTLNVRAEKDKVRVELRDNKNHDMIENEHEEEFEESESIDSEKLEIEYERKPNEKQKEREKKRLEIFTEEKKQYFENLREEKKDLAEEIIEFKSELKEKKHVLKLETRKARASLKEGAEFSLDSETNEVTVTTPSGDSHILYHLPDQSIARMQDAGLLSLTEEDEKLEVEIDVQDDGTILHRAKNHKVKRFLGIFKREIPTEVVLNDSTGDVSEIEDVNRTDFQKMLDALSF